MRPNPNVLLPGDAVYIPAPIPKQVTCATGRSHLFQINGDPHCVRIIVKDFDGNPYANTKYELTVEDQVLEGATDQTGLIYRLIQKPTEEAELKLPELGLGWKLKIGHLDPVQEPDSKTAIPTGVKARLKNLGYYAGEVDPEMDDSARDALKRFQATVLKRDQPDGEPDSDTCRSLEEQHCS